MAAPEKLSPVLERLRKLLAESQSLRRRAEELGHDTAARIEDTEKRIAECLRILGERDPDDGAR